MLQPRKRKFILKIVPKGLLLCVIILLTFTHHYAKGEDEKNGLIKDKIKRGDRVIRHGDVNIVVLDDIDRRKITPSLGLLSTTARTFIQEGTTTEFATHVYGTTVGDKYAHIVSTGSKIFYNNVRPSKDKAVDPIITIPALDSLIFSSEDNFIIPSKVTYEKPSEKLLPEKFSHKLTVEKHVTPNKEETSNKLSKSLKANILSISEKTPITVISPTEGSSKSIHNHVSVRKEISIKPARVKVKNELPTFTVKQDSSELESHVYHIQNSEFEVDNAILLSKNDKEYIPEKTPRLYTTTYFGFADFVTTAGNTVIIFTPQTKKPVFEGTVTSIRGEPILVQNTIFPSHTRTTTSSPVLTTPKLIEPVEPADTTESSETNISSSEETESNESVEYVEQDQHSQSTEANIDEHESNDDHESKDEHESVDVQESPTTQKEDRLDEVVPITTPQVPETTAESIDSTSEPVTENIEENQITTTLSEDLVKNEEVPFLESSINLESSFSSNLSPSSTTDVYQTVAYTSTSPSLPNKASSSESQSTTSSIFTTEDVPELTTLSNVLESNDSSTESDESGNNESPITTEKNDIGESVPSTAPKPSKSEEEVELVFKTLYTTYTYLTTYFERSTTQVKSREEVVTNVVTSTLDSAFLQLATDPAVAGLFSGHREAKYLPGNAGVGRPTTFYHRISSEPISENEIVSSSQEAKKSTPSLKFHPRLTESRLKPLHSVLAFDHSRKSSLHAYISSTADPHALLKTRLYSSARASHRLIPSLRHTPPLHPYKSTIVRHRLSNPVDSSDSVTPSSVNNVLAENTSLNSIITDNSANNSVIISAPLTSIKETTEQSPKKIFLSNDSDDDQLSQESNTEGTRPNPSLISLQTSYTTYTYFTTIYKGSTSDIISRLETVTNVNTELIKPTSTDSTLLTEEATAPVTYYTTYTYWTTFYKDGSTMIKSRQETVSSIITATPTRESTTESIEPTSLSSLLDPATYYTTFTYFTTSYVDNSSVVSSHLQTVTNIIKASKTTTENPEKSSSNPHPVFDPSNTASSVGESEVRNDLISIKPNSVPNSILVDNNSRNVPSDILKSSSITRVQDPSKPTGTISVEEGKIVDAFNISTTFYTTRVIGTFIQTLYAELIESTSTVQVNTEQRSNLISPSTVILNDRIYQTGLLLTNEGSIVKGNEITHYATKIIGSIINGQYSSITETSSSVQIDIAPTKATEIKPTSSIGVSLSSTTPTTEFTTTSPSPAVIESSLNDHHDTHDTSDEDDKTKNKTRRKSFTPVIRPFASRSRPTFLPKKKTGETSVAATITRGITPTIVASPALKTSETRVFGTANRNRFAGGSRKISSTTKQTTELQSATPTSRRFSRPKSNIPYSSSNTFQRTSSTSASFSGYRRGSSYRPSSSRAVDIHPSLSSVGSRFRIRPTPSRRFNLVSTTTPRVEEEQDDIEEDASIITEQTLSQFDNEDISLEKLPVSSAEVSQRNNPLLRFRKPGSARQSPIPATSTFKTTTQRRNIGSRRNDKLTPPPTTAKPSTSFPPRSNYLSGKLRLKPANSLFPQKNTAVKTKEPAVEDESSEAIISDGGADVEQVESGEDIVELESDQNFGNSNVEEKSTRASRVYNPVSIKPFPRRGRVKRQSEYGYKYENIRGQNSRYRRPSVSQNTFPDYLYYDDLEYTTEDISARSIGATRNTYSKPRNTQPLQHSYQSSYHQQPEREQQVSHKIRPSGVSHGRTPFTLREKTSSTSPAPQRSSSRHRGSFTNRKHDSYVTKRPSRQRYYSTTTEPSYRSNSRKQLPTRRTSNTRSRYKDNDYNNANTYSSASFDGSLTVTYKIPTEATIPIVNGKVTEYKNVVTAKPSIQVLGPNQYSTVTGKNGLTTLQLVAENSETMLNGIVEVTRYVIQEFPTSSVTFTPTTIRGRKTSFSHIIPSTVYEVRPEVSTIPPQLNANAPLANLLLSQLLLGNLGIQPTLNPLLGLNGQQANGQPVTEFKTKTTSYVTTITHSTSTVIPVTFRGKEIKTTIVDSSTQVITATEYLTDTIVITPTNAVQAPTNQLNTLLLPALLQAQLLNQPQTTTSSAIPPSSSGDENVADNLQLIQDNPTPSRVLKNIFNLDNDNIKVNDDLDQQKDGQRKKSSKPKSFDSPIEPAETSVVTLYLSGRRPGEFSTVLSTVTLDDKSATLRKRHIDTVQPPDLKPSDIPPLHTSFAITDDDYIDSVLKSGLNDISAQTLENEHQETQSLESIIGDVSEHLLHKQLATQLEDKAASASTKTLNQMSNHFLLKTSAEDAPFQRNSTTPVFRGERMKRSPEPAMRVKKVVHRLGFLGVRRNQQEKSVLLNASSTENSFHGVLKTLEHKNTGEHTNRSRINHQAIDKNVEDEGRGRYNLATKVMSNGVEVIVALDKSTLPGSPQLLRVLPTSIRPITLTPSTVTDHMIMMLPHGLQDVPDPFITKTYLTTYTYLTTFLDEGTTSSSSQEKVVSNIFTENIDSTSLLTDASSVDRHVTLSSSPILATKVFETTYNVESTIRDGGTPQIVLSQQTVSNTITAPEDFLQPSEASFNEISPQPLKESPAEDYSIQATEKLSANFETQSSNTIDVKPSAAQAADITKTYFVTYTYYSTLLENGSTVVRSKVATSSDVVTEKYYVPLKRTKVPPSPPTTSKSTNEKLATTVVETLVERPIHILATKTYLTTFTYFTTLLQENKIDRSTQTMIRSRTKVVQNLVTETLNPDLLNSEYLSVLRNSLKKDSIPITATATLNDGQRLEITAVNENLSSASPDQVTSSLEENEVYYNEIGNETPPKSENSASNSTGPSKNPKINETRYTFSTAVLPTATVVKNGVTLSPGSQVIKFTDLVNGNVSVIPVSDPVSKHPAGGQNVNRPDTKIQMNDLLSLGSALKPVINAVAGLWQNNLKSNIKVSESNVKPISHPYIEKNPVEDLLTSLKPPNRTPIYIPVGPLPEDNEGAESENVYQHQYPDVDERNTLASGNREAVEKPLVSGGGIPISPGQVITANTDVIVGTPAVLGPRPPAKNSNDKSDVPIGMLPPPVSSLVPNFSGEEADRGSSVSHKYGDFIKIPPKPLSPTFLNNVFPPSNHIKHPVKPHYKYVVDQKISLPSEIKFSQVHPNAPPPPTKKPTPALDLEENIIQPAKLQHPILIEHSTLNPLLVNLRPSQVAQVIIPHGSQTAFVYSDEPVSHNTKGEIFNDPSPYPEENVNPGFVGLEVYGPVNPHAYSPHAQGTSSKVSSNTIHLDIPINPFVANGSITESHHFVTVNLDANSPLIPASNEIGFASGEEGLRNDIKNNFSATVHSNIDVGNSPSHLLPWQPPVYSSERPYQRPYIFPQDKPNTPSEVGTEPQPHYNFINSHTGNEASEEISEPVAPIDNDEFTQETKIKPSSNPDSSQSKNENSFNYSEKEPSNPVDSDVDLEFNHNWEILKEKPVIRSTTTRPSSSKNEVDSNSTTRDHGNVIYSQWNTMESPSSVRPNFSEITVHGNIGHLNPHVAIDNMDRENTTKVGSRKPVSNRNSQDDIVIGMSPPPLLPPSAPPPSPPVQPVQPSRLPPSLGTKIPRPSVSSLKPAPPERKPLPSRRPSPLKNKPKPTNPPYPFEKPTPAPPTKRPKPPVIIDKPPPNILYETNAPNFGEDLMKLKPLNTTGRIEPVKKWPSWSTTGKPNSPPVYGNIEKVQEVDKKEDARITARSTTTTPAPISRSTTDTSAAQSDAKIIVIDKQDRPNVEKTTELISKWSESGVISSSKTDIEETYEDQRTPLLEVANRTKGNSVPNTIFGNLYTRPPPANIVIIPTHSTTQHHTAISMVIDHDPSSDRDSDASYTFNLKNDHIAVTSTYTTSQSKVHNKDHRPADRVEHSVVTPTYYVTHTTTSFVTITQSTVVERDGQPTTRTVVLTKTQTSTLIDTVTKIETLLQPTSVLSTITSTIPITVSREIISTVTATDVLPSIVTPIYSEKPSDEDSIFVVMTDKKSGGGHVAPAPPIDPRPTGFEVQVPDEANEISPNDILFSGIYTQHADNECRPECKVTKNEMCQKVDNTMRCVCRPGFARIFPDHPCKPTYTYIMRVPLDRQGPDEIRYTDSLADRTSPSHQQLTEATRDGLDRMVMQSNLRDIYHGIVVSGFEPAKKSNKAAVVYIVQLSENAEETKLQDEIHKTLKANNYSLGGTDVYAAPDMYHFIRAEDFDECTDNKYHDCSDNAQCFNLRGTYTCSCKEGFTDMSYNAQFPGRVCSADGLGCELCNYHGTCYYKAEEEPTCECFQWYAGELCQINLKVTLISLIVIGVLLTVLLVVCLVMTCNKPKSPEILRTAPKPHVGFRRYRSVTNIPGDKRAIVSVDTSSEGSIERTPPPLIKKSQRIVRSEPPIPVSSHGGESVMVHSPEQRDRNLTVLIPRAKYRPVSSQQSSTLLTMSTFGPEQKLLNYAASRESSRTPEKKVSRCSMHSRRLSNSTNMSAEAQPRKKISAPRRASSGALVSAGFEVSATVRRTQELDEAFITPTQMDLNQPTYNSIRTVESSTVVDVPPLPVFESSLEDFITRVDKLGTVSEARSYDETTIQPPMRSLHNLFHLRTHTCDSKHSSSHKTNLDENHTMGERDLGSTYMPKSQLYKPDHRESDGSNFDSL